VQVRVDRCPLFHEGEQRRDVGTVVPWMDDRADITGATTREKFGG
jgi:hypothetical protein